MAGPRKRIPEETRARLVRAAQAEFNTRGFDGTDTNRIAGRAGYAPQTFYRHFPDKTAIFLAVYDAWWRAESAALAQSKARTAKEAARIALDFHKRWRIFRRSLRHLAIVDANVRKARTLARTEQIERWKKAGSRRSHAELAAALLAAERLLDAAAEGELADLGLKPAAVQDLAAAAMAALMRQKAT
jgi:AcrR family transcriptional regulator